MAAAKGKIIIWVMLITILSKCFGFGRDVVLAHFFGAGDITDAYFVSQTIPEFLFSLVVQTIGIGFIPIYVEILHKQSKQSSNHFATQVLFGAWLLCVGLVVFVHLFTAQIVHVFAANFSLQAAHTAITFVRISVLAMFFRISTSVVSACLQANNEFIFPAAIGLPFDIVVISSVVIASFTTPILLAWGLVAAAATQIIFLLPIALKKIKFQFHRLFPLLTPNLKKMAFLFLPVALGVSANQINILVDRTLASAVQGGISALNYATKTNNVVENIIILSLAMVMFPTFSTYASQKNFNAFITSVTKSLNIVMFTMIPCSMLFILFAPNIIQLLFGHGAFSISSTQQTISVMRCYAIGLLGLSCSVILIRSLYAIQKVGWVSITACCTVTINVILNLILSRYMGISGLALATSIANICSALFLFGLLTKYLQMSLWRLFVRDLIKCFFSALVMGTVCFYLYRVGLHFMPSILSCGGSIVIGGVIYVALCSLLRCDSWSYSYAILYEIKNKLLLKKSTEVTSQIL